jgi:hypothetical protein
LLGSGVADQRRDGRAIDGRGKRRREVSEVDGTAALQQAGEFGRSARRGTSGEGNSTA